MAGADRAYIHEGDRVAVRADRGSEVWDYTEKERGIELTKVRDKDRPITAMLIHHGMKSPQETASVLDKRGLSTHLITAKNRIYQAADLSDETLHGGFANFRTIGLDIAQDTNPKRLQWHRDRQGLIIDVVDNPAYPKRSWSETGARKKINSLDSRTLNSTVDAMLDMHEIFGIPIRVPRNPDGSLRFTTLPKAEAKKFLEEGGFLAHFHTSATKWDPPWWEEIVRELYRRVGSTPEGGGGGGLTTVGKPAPPAAGEFTAEADDNTKSIIPIVVGAVLLIGGMVFAFLGTAYFAYRMKTKNKRKRRRRR